MAEMLRLEEEVECRQQRLPGRPSESWGCLAVIALGTSRFEDEMSAVWLCWVLCVCTVYCIALPGRRAYLMSSCRI